MASCTECEECSGLGGWIEPPGSPHWVDCDRCGGSGKWRPHPTPDDDAFDAWRDEKI
jgi:DnaJ-class molecular chaperone